MDKFNQYQALTRQIIGCAIEVNNQLGPGLLESAYQKCLKYELVSNGLHVDEELALPIIYKEIKLDQGYRIDLLVEILTDVHEAQILTYLKLGGFPIGFLLNFNVKLMKNGIKRYVY